MPVKTVNRILIPTAAMLLFFIACRSDSKSDKTELAKIYVEILILEEEHAAHSDSLDFYKSRLFDKEGISKENFETQIAELGSDQLKWKEFFALSNQYLDSLKSKLKNPSKKDTLL